MKQKSYKKERTLLVSEIQEVSLRPNPDFPNPDFLFSFSQIFVQFEPPLWPRENGTICPFGVSVILLEFPCFIGISTVLGFGSQIHHLSFSTRKMALSTLQKHYGLKGKCPILMRKYSKACEKNAKRTNGSIFCCHIGQT